MKPYAPIVGLMICSAVCAQETSTDLAQSTTLDEVLVTGEQPGPGLWKVSKDDHTLWIVGTHSPLPKKITWRSKDVEALVAESQEVIGPVKIDADTNIGFFRAITLIPTLMGAAKNPDDAKLKDVVPADIYAKWTELKNRYIGKDQSVEKWRPTFAAQELRSKAIDQAKLSSDAVVWPLVEKAAKKNRRKIVQPEVKLKFTIDNPRQTLKKFRKTELPDVECFAKTLSTLEADVLELKQRANAWAIGDVDVLRKLNKEPGVDCMQVLQTAIVSGSLANDIGAEETVQNAKKEFERGQKEAEAKWLAMAKDSLARNTVTFGVLSVQELLRKDGYLDKLRTAGYSVEEP